MAYEFFQETPANVDFSADSGYGTQVFFRELQKFTSIAEAPNTGTEEGETRIITDDHTFPVDEGFIKASGHQSGGEMEAQSQGEAGFLGQMPYKHKVFLVGDKAALRERVENMKNRPFIMIFKDPNCQDTRMLQLGCGCDPAIVSDAKFMSGNRKTGGKKGYEITFESTCLFDYQGILTLKEVA